MNVYAIYLLTSGALVAQITSPVHPSDPASGFAWNAEKHGAKVLAVPGDGAFQTWSPSARAWVDDVAKIEAPLIAAVKAEAERRKMLTASTGGYKKTEYAAKRAEVNAFDSLGGSVQAILAALNLLPASIRETRFAYASADAAAFGDTIQAAITRFRSGMTASGNPAVIAAIEAKGCAAIRAAQTVQAKRAAYTAINWTA